MTKLSNRTVEYRKKFEKVFDLFKSGDGDNALKEANGLLPKYENEGSLHFLIGLVLFNMDKYQKAAKHFRKATLLGPKSENASLGLFLSLWSIDKRSEALDEMKRYLSDNRSPEYEGILKSIMSSIEEDETTEPGVVADGSRLHIGPTVRKTRQVQGPRRAGKRARG